jgi:hypothetical protein
MMHNIEKMLNTIFGQNMLFFISGARVGCTAKYIYHIYTACPSISTHVLIGIRESFRFCVSILDLGDCKIVMDVYGKIFIM